MYKRIIKAMRLVENMYDCPLRLEIDSDGDFTIKEDHTGNEITFARNVLAIPDDMENDFVDNVKSAMVFHFNPDLAAI